MTLKTYIVALNKDVDYNQFWAEIEDPTTGLEYIPDRPVAIANNRTPFNRICEYSLTDAEAEKLREDPRVAGVEIPVEHRDDIEVKLMATSAQNFTKPTGTQTAVSSGGNNVNWGLIRNSNLNNVYGTGNTTNLNYTYSADGSGVDVVISDSGIQADHPEFQYVGNVTSRVQQVNWGNYVPALLTMGNSYQDSNGHGTNVSGIVAGKTFGWAKNSLIYSILYDSPVLDQFEAILLWHQSKGVNGRPTVVNMSWGTIIPYQYFGPSPILAINNFLGNITSVTYQGTTYPGNANVTTYGLLLNSANVYCRASMANGFPAPYSPYDVALQELLDNGIVVCRSAGNNSYKIDVPGGVDYNNYVSAYGDTGYYQQGSSPTAPNAIVVGSIATTAYSNTQDQKSYFSCAGPGVDIYAAGNNIMSAGTSNTSAATYNISNVYFLNNSYRQLNDTGTSQASPQVAGIIALYLQVHPFANNLSPNNASQVKSWVTSIGNASALYSPGNATTYTNFESLLGGNSVIAYQPYTSALNATITGTITMSNVSLINS